MNESGRTPSLGVYTVGGECGVLVVTSRFHPPMVNDPMPSHACYRAASNVQCVVRTVITSKESHV